MLCAMMFDVLTFRTSKIFGDFRRSPSPRALLLRADGTLVTHCGIAWHTINLLIRFMLMQLLLSSNYKPIHSFDAIVIYTFELWYELY